MRMPLRSMNHRGRRERGTTPKIKGDTCLVLACSDVSIDAVARSDQTGMRYWQHTEDKFLQAHSLGATPVSRPYRSLQGQWDVIKACCSHWAGDMEQVRVQPPSGNSVDVYVNTLDIFCCNSCFAVTLLSNALMFCNCECMNVL
jgi:hypothetical protein